MRRVLKPLSSVLLVVGALLLADAVVTLVWQEPVSALYAKLEQGQLDDDLAKLEGTEPTATDRKVLSRLGTLDRKLAYASRALNRRTDDGQPLGRIRMHSIGVNSVVVEGTDTSSLRRGPGHYPGTPLPGARGTVAIAGHRTTYGAPFRRLDKLDTGDRIRCRCRTGASSTRSSASGSCRRRRPGSPSGCATTGSCCRPATRSIRRPSGSSSSPGWSTRNPANDRLA